MISYNEFKKIVEAQLKEYMPEPYKSMEWDCHEVQKVNETLDAINFISTGVAPTVYINSMYKQYKNGEDIPDILKNVAETMIKAMKEKDKIIPDLDFNNAKDNIVFQLINTEQNKGMLENVPHREFQDLSIIYKWIINQNEEGIASITIKNDTAKQLKLSENELYNIAKENTKKLLPIVIKPMKEIIINIMVNDGVPHEIVEAMFKNSPMIEQMHVISNKIGVNGASVLLYEEVLEELANILNSDLYIMPSSIHECIAVSTNDLYAEELSEMVESINMNQVELKDRLSNQVYLYDKETKKISVASTNPNKKLN